MRYGAAGGLQYRPSHSRFWFDFTANMLFSMNGAGLRGVARAMDAPGDEVEIDTDNGCQWKPLSAETERGSR